MRTDLRILRILIDSPSPVGELTLAKRTGMTSTTIRQHLRELQRRHMAECVYVVDGPSVGAPGGYSWKPITRVEEQLTLM